MSDFVDFSILLEEDDEEDEEYIPAEEEEEDEDEDGGEETTTAVASGDANDLIAKRTRSKFQIENVIGDTLQFPDVEPDLYNLSEGDDFEWTGFCKALFADDPVEEEPEDDDDNDDPEYVAGEDEAHFHDSSEARLIVPADEVDAILDDGVSVSSLASPVSNPSEWSACFTADHLKQLKDQFAMYAQLLGQQYFLCRERQTLLPLAYDCVGKICELNELAESCDVAQVENLDPLISLIREHPLKPVKGRLLSLTWRKCAITRYAKNVIVDNPNVFVCEKLIPEHGFYDLPAKKTAPKFFPSEDDLIIIGIQNFKKYDNSVVRRRYCKFIQELILPTKTESQIKSRIKNCKRRCDPKNRLSCFLRNGTVEAVTPIPVERLKNLHNAADCPNWMKLMHKSSPPPKPVTRFRPVVAAPLRVSNPFKRAHSIVKKYKLMSCRSSRSEAELVSGKQSHDPDSLSPQDSPCEHEISDPISRTNDHCDAEPMTNDLLRSFNEEDEDVDDENDADNESELAALMAASSTISYTNRVRKTIPNKQDILNKQNEMSQKIRSLDWNSYDPDQELREQTLVEYFMQKARDVLRTEDDFVRFLKLLSEFHESRQRGKQKTDLKDVFKKLESFLIEVHGERLIDELILFLDIREAMQLGKMYEFLYWKRFTTFLRKIEISTTIDSQMLVRLFKTLSQLKSNPASIDKSRIKSAVSRALNGHPLLMAEFMTLFLDEAPPAHLFTNEQDFDHITNISDDENEDHSFEGSANIPAHNESLYGTNDCPCTLCHRLPGEKLSHCHRCCIILVDNQMHFVSGTKPVLATLEFSEKPSDEIRCEQEKDNNSSNNNNNKPTEPTTPCKRLRTCDENETATVEWSPEDDAILLQAVQEQLAGNDSVDNVVFEEIANRVNKSLDQVSVRFSALMQVIGEVSSPEKNVKNGIH